MNQYLLTILIALLLGVIAYLLMTRPKGRSSVAETLDGSLRPPALGTQGVPEWEREIIERMAEGVLVLDDRLVPVLANGAARTLLGLQEVSLPRRLPSEEVLAIARRVHGEESAEALVNVWFPSRMNLRVRAAPLEGRGGVVVVLQDVTQELRTQRIRREFVAHASHELKSPVASLQALAEAVEGAVRDDPDASERMARQIVAESERLSRLISDLLDLSRLEEMADVPQGDSNLSHIAECEADEVGNLAASKGVRLQRDVLPSVWVRGDDQQLGLMVRNLLDNAIRYTSDNGTVSMKVCREDGEAIVEVSDTGIGIPLEAQERVFERFYRVDRARSRDRGGTGLGLAIVKHVVELHGGKISLQSELGHGTTFMIRLPAKTVERQEITKIAG